MKLLRTDKGITGIDLGLIGWYQLRVEDSIIQNTNRLEVVAGSTKVVTPVFSFGTSGDRMIASTPQSGTLISTSFQFSVNAGDSIYFVPESGNWDNLKELSFYNDKFIFSLEDITDKVSSLTSLDIGLNDAATGNIDCLASLINLTYLRLDSTGVVGSIENFILLVNLVYLRITNTTINGSITNLSALYNLTELYLDSTGVDGSVTSLSALVNLINLRISSTGVDGDVIGLKDLIKLITLYANSTGVDGDVIGLKDLIKLTVLRLDSTGVDGDVIGLKDLIKLTYLRLDNTGVDGDVIGLKDLIKLTDLFLSFTSVTGDLADLNTLSLLVNLRINNTGTTYSTTTFQPRDLYWYDITPIMLVTVLNTLLADAVASGKSNLYRNIGGNNPPATDSQALANIATIQGLGGTVIYNKVNLVIDITEDVPNDKIDVVIGLSQYNAISDIVTVTNPDNTITIYTVTLAMLDNGILISYTRTASSTTMTVSATTNAMGDTSPIFTESIVIS